MHRDQDNRSRTEGDKQTGREKQKCTVMERDKEIWMGRTRKKQVDKEKEKKRDGVHSKNQAAIVIQRAWRRYLSLLFLPWKNSLLPAHFCKQHWFQVFKKPIE